MNKVQELNEKIYRTRYGDVRYFISEHPSKDDPALVFLPGLSADHRLFEMQTEYFSKKYTCITWDPPAHGKSRPFELKFSMEDMADYLEGIFARENISSVILVGQSLGGYVAQVYMQRYPQRVKGFVSIDSCSLDRSYYTKAETYLLRRTEWMYRCIPWNILRYIAIYGTSKSDRGRNIMRRMLDDYSKDEYCLLADHGYRIFADAVESDKYGRIKCPLLLICGKKDNSGSAKSYNRRWAKREGHRLEWIENAGHNANTDDPDNVNRLIEEFADFAGEENK